MFGMIEALSWCLTLPKDDKADRAWMRAAWAVRYKPVVRLVVEGVKLTVIKWVLKGLALPGDRFSIQQDEMINVTQDCTRQSACLPEHSLVGSCVCA